MKRLLAIGVTGFIVFGSGAAEAARCPLGQIYRSSAGVCQSKQAAIRQGVYRPRPKAASAYGRPPRARTVPPGPNWIIEYDRHVQAWAAKNRNSIIKSMEGMQ